MAINPQKLLPPGRTGGSLTKVSKKVISTDSFSNFGSSKISKDIGVIKIKVIQIENILKGTVAAEKKALDEKKRLESGKRREKQEEKLETKKQPEKGEIKTPKVPRMGFLDWIKNFIGNVLLGYFAVRMLDFLPKIKPIIGFLGSAADFLIDTGGKLLDGLVTFIDWGYKAIDFTKGMMKSLGGEGAEKAFEGFMGTIGNLVETAIIAAAVIGSMGDGGGEMGTTGIRGAAGQAGRSRYGTSTAAARRYAERYGVDAARKKFGSEAVKSLGGKYARSGATNLARKGLVGLAGKGGTKVILGTVRPLLKRLPIIGALIDFGLSVALGEDPGRAAFKAIGAGLLGSIGAAIGSVVPIAGNIVGGIAGGMLGDAVGAALYDLFFGGKKPQQKNQKVQKKAGGGITRGGKAQTGARRTIGGKKKYKRQIPRKPGEVEIKPGADVGGEDKIFGIFPNPLKAAQKVVDAVNPFNVVKSAGENLGKTDYFGPILAITSKITLGQKPSQKDYENVGLGINMLIAKGIQEKQLKGGIVAAFAEGGLVDPDVLSAAETGGDISNWVAKTFQGEIESNAQKTLRLIKENTRKKKEDSDASTSPRDSGESGSIETAGGAVAASELYKEIGANLEQWDIYRNSIALIESKGKYGIPGGSGMHYDGRYQMGRDAKIDGSRVAGVPNPGHSDDPNAHVRVSFRNNPQLQETIFTGFTIANHRYLMRNPKYKSASVERKLEILGYAHNQGMGGAENWLNTGKVGADGFGTKGTKYTDLIAKNFRAKKSGGQMELATGAVGIPEEPSGPTAATLKGKFGLLSLGGSSAPGGDRTLTASSTFSNTHLHHNKPDSDPYNRGPKRINKIPRDYVITRGDQSKDRGAPVPSGVSGKVDYASGHTVVIKDSKGVDRTQFHHFDSISVRPGQTVSPNTILGKQGNAGTGVVHVHLDASASDHTSWIRGIAKSSAFHGESFGIVPKGGMKLTLHEGEMFRVFDKDSVNVSVKLLGYDLTKDIISIENKAQLVAKAPAIIERLKSISGYADYEQPYAEPQIIEVPVEVPVPMGDYQSSGGGVALIPFGGGDDPFETLYKGG